MADRSVLSSRAQERRGQVLADLTELFLAEGFLDFGLGDLAARLHCSRSTIYLVADSKEQVLVAVVRHYFRRAAGRIEERVAAEPGVGERLAVYLTAVADELRPASPRFYADLLAYRPAREIYLDNTRRAARRVQDLVEAGVAVGALRTVDATFVGAAVAQVMAAIQNGGIAAATGLDDAAAYRALADLVVHGLTRSGRSVHGGEHETP